MQNKTIQRDFNHAASTYNHYARLQKQVAENLVNIASSDIASGTSVLDIGCGTGFIAQACTMPVLQMDIAPAMLQHAAQFGDTLEGDMHAIPLDDNSVQHVLSSMTLQWANPLPQVLSEIARVLKPGGTAHIALPLYGTLTELEEALDSAGEAGRILPFFTENNVLAAAEQANLAVKQEITAPHTMWHNSVKAVLNSIRQVGAANKSQTRAKPLTKTQLSTITHSYEDNFRRENGLPATWNIGYFVLEKL